MTAAGADTGAYIGTDAGIGAQELLGLYEQMAVIREYAQRRGSEIVKTYADGGKVG